MTTRNRVLEIARSYEGIGEVPPGSNCTAFGVRHGAPCQPWCGASAMSAYEDAGVTEPAGHVYVPTWALQAYELGRWSWDPYDAQPGDTVIFTWDGSRIIGWSGDHVGILDHIESNGTLVVWEGNAYQPAIGGDGWGLRYRSPALVMGIGLVPFPDLPPPRDLPPEPIPEEMPMRSPIPVTCLPEGGSPPASRWYVVDMYDLPNVATWVIIKAENDRPVTRGRVYVTLSDGTGADGNLSFPFEIEGNRRVEIRVDEVFGDQGASATVETEEGALILVAGSYVAET